MKKLLILMMLTSSCLAITKDQSANPFALKIDQEIYITDEKGVLLEKSIITLMPGRNVRIYLLDGTLITGIIKTAEVSEAQDKKLFKVFGEATNQKNVNFGFAITNEGVVGGAVAFHDREVIYKIKYLEDAKGYVLVPEKIGKTGS
jgi:hypothetical protein